MGAVGVVSGDSGRWENISFIGEASVSGLPYIHWQWVVVVGVVVQWGLVGASECLQRVVEIISFVG